MAGRSCCSVQANARILALQIGRDFDSGTGPQRQHATRNVIQSSARDDQAAAGNDDPAAVLTTNGIDTANAR